MLIFNIIICKFGLKYVYTKNPGGLDHYNIFNLVNEIYTCIQLIFYLIIIWQGSNYSELFRMRNKLIMVVCFMIDLSMIGFIVFENIDNWMKREILSYDVFMLNVVAGFG